MHVLEKNVEQQPDFYDPTLKNEIQQQVLKVTNHLTHEEFVRFVDEHLNNTNLWKKIKYNGTPLYQTWEEEMKNFDQDAEKKYDDMIVKTYAHMTFDQIRKQFDDKWKIDYLWHDTTMLRSCEFDPVELKHAIQTRMTFDTHPEYLKLKPTNNTSLRNKYIQHREKPQYVYA
jgi:hypothetical protein